MKEVINSEALKEIEKQLRKLKTYGVYPNYENDNERAWIIKDVIETLVKLKKVKA